jgi:hypothetical protein
VGGELSGKEPFKQLTILVLETSTIPLLVTVLPQRPRIFSLKQNQEMNNSFVALGLHSTTHQNMLCHWPDWESGMSRLLD